MPYFNMRKVWTPLQFLGVKLYKTDDGIYFIKFFNGSHKMVNRWKYDKMEAYKANR